MKIKVKETIEHEVEVKLPTYRKTNCHFFSITSETECIQVTDLNGHYEIKQCNVVTALSEKEESTKKEFNDAFKRILTKLKN